MKQAFDDVRVLDLSRWVAGDYCAKLLGDLGADVIKIEKPGEGALTRHQGPFPGDIPDPERSALFLHLNTNKRSVTLNLDSDSGRQILLDLARTADVVVEAFRPGTMERLGLGWDDLAAVNPRLVLTRISSFGQSGPYRNYEATNLTLEAMGTAMHMSGLADRPPLRRPGELSQYSIGSTAAEATAAALLVAKLQGEGQVVDVAGFESLLTGFDRRIMTITGQQYVGDDPPRGKAAGALPVGAFPCADGYVMFTILLPYVLPLVKLLDDPALNDMFAADPMAVMSRPAEFKELLDAALYPWLLARTKEQVMTEAQAGGVPVTAVYDVADIRASDHFRGRGVFATLDHPRAGTLEYLAPAIRMDAGPSLRRPAPLLGEHTAEVLGELGIDGGKLAALHKSAVI